ncbi:MAG: CPBP family intramembrane metalloprotease [Prevotella sp.]|nr:CPBP family intramembrane metalloprotease [Prevotella sp.]
MRTKQILLYAVALPVGFLAMLWVVALLSSHLGCPPETKALVSAFAKIAFACACLYFFREIIQTGERGGLTVGRFLLCFFYLGIPFLANAVMSVLGSESLRTGFASITAGVILGIAPGFCEEVVFRGVSYNQLNALLGKRRNACLWAALLSSGVFALCHFVNLTSQPMAATAVQVYYAFAAGMCFCGIYLFSRTLVIPILLHCIVDVCHFLPIMDRTTTNEGAVNLLYIGFTTFLLIEGLALVLIHQRMMRKRNQSH